MPRLFELHQWLTPGKTWGRRLLLLLLWLGLFSASSARPSPAAIADYQRRLRGQRFDHRYWDAPHDSLRRVLASQRADTLRFQTLNQLFNLTDLSQEALPDLLGEHREAQRLANRLHYPERVPLRLVVAFDELALRPAPNLSAMRDTLLAALRAYDALGSGPQPYLLEWIKQVMTELKQPEANRTFFTHRLAHEQQRGNVMNSAICYRMLGNYYGALGDYNQAISQRMRAAELFRTCSAFRYYNELGAIGITYTEWGNHARALPFLQKALTMPGFAPETYYAAINHALARAYFKLGRYKAARRCNARILRPHRPAATVAPYDRALGLVQESAILLALGRPAAAHPLLVAGQHLVDSLQLPLRSYAGYCELQASWARYYTATAQEARALHAWETALHQARQERQAALTLDYLRGLATSCQRQGQAARAATYGLAALALADTLEAAEVATRVARYEFEQDDRAQQQRLEHLRRAQQRSTAQVQQQRVQLGGLLAGLAVLSGLAGLLWRNARQKSRDNALLAAQQQQLEDQARRLGELDAAKNQFFANASHELRTPLTLVLAPLETLLTDPNRPLPAAVRGPVALAHRQAGRLNELVNRILDLTRLQAGRLPVQPVLTALGTFLHRVVTQFAPLAAARGLTLRGPDTVPEVLHLLVDADKVEQILTNLLINALNHTPAGGTLVLTADLPGPDGYYAITVRDTGPGIAPAEQERVFERFYQSPQNQAQGGTGLGLALSRELAELLGGTLTLVSEPGQGAAFTLRFPAEEVKINELKEEPEGLKAGETQTTTSTGPAADAASVSLTPASEGPSFSPQLLPANSSPRVLVVEDESDLREYLRELLAPTCQVLTAADGQAALELLAREAPIDLITTDAMMPRLSGIDLIATLKADPTWSRVPVLMLTARADEDHRRTALTVGVDDYLTKPFAPAELLARVQLLLTRYNVRRHFAALPAEAPDEPVSQPEPTVVLAPTDRAVAATLQAPPPAVGEQLAQWQTQVAAHLADEQFGTTELARLLGLSERTLYRRLGELAGLTPAAWLRELRLHQARQLLEAGGFGSVAAVADAVGFASAKHFSNVYAERFGRRPSEYQAAQQ
ncbi:hybrid sensor histidine kinase/response regulator transcription factor [Hymenobacter guriensis]|uniref:histidine kinase n=1 Tax=Hymenobacter guriensis TaxID=2793065 RepID=A0ABS0L287_9BACT|nr:ATP-binding protein [Hymenobacter guriensis]MBG8554193.1 response regulator [Hymenobacter guriensis]